MTGFLKTQIGKFVIKAPIIMDGFFYPKKKNVKTTFKNANLDNFDVQVIRRTIQNFYEAEKVLTILKLKKVTFQEGKKHCLKYYMKLDSDGETAKANGN